MIKYVYGILAIAGLSYIGYLQVDNWGKARSISKLTTSVAELQIADTLNKVEIKDRTEDKANTIVLTNSYTRKLQDAYKHPKPINLERLQNAYENKPGLVHNLINDATNSILQEFHSITSTK